MIKKTIHLIGAIAGAIVLLALVFTLNFRTMLNRMTSSSYAPDSIIASSTSKSGFVRGSMLIADEAASYELIEDPTAGPVGEGVEQKIIRNGSLEIIVESISSALTDIGAIAKRNGGFTQNSNAGERSDGTRYGSITVRVPFETYDAATADIKLTAIKVTSESSNAQDVTEQYTDLQAQLSVAHEEEQAYLRLLDRSGSVSDLLQVQRELSQVRTRIESLEGRIQYLDNQTSLATITVSLEEEASLNVPTKPFRPDTSITNALQSLVVIGQGVVTAAIWLVVLGIGIGIPVYAIYRIARAVYRKTKR
ncbi:hypothetical protein A3C17_03575 [Candidatus Uhrbacteria bacterium RIFCSPHIGHO2_02_FULL_53_13]|uniref:DUF4349 domain-containing protein n=2 Tax=Candidatus Uhriibacteriota TaxID=1752732 RepID=A0A1F7U0Z1_9BACT|nr:MAG: hypothetical protein A3C17_03575 [Candidatus Uhrbacteria bacterium RIFCSPHIGHO2_02_FULL_53_13]OGL89269.1 MAG: hypothetical protein A3I45_04895 [Candidatus Uhrbacteria bacterium RIFCSPLOWO2_02_FULL_53_10]